MLLFGALSLVLTELFRHRPILVLATIPGVISQMWIYGRRYDHTNLFILVVALGLLALERREWRHWIVFGLVAACLWVPTGGAWPDWFPLLQNALWIGGVALLLRHPPSASVVAPTSIGQSS